VFLAGRSNLRFALVPPDSLVTSVAPATSLIERTLGPDWRCLADAVIRAGGESGPVDLVALHPRLGVVLVAFLDDDEEASPDEAVAALRAHAARVRLR
jgi:hypothetical protein